MNENFYQHQSVHTHVQPNVGRRNKSIYYKVYIKSIFFFIENKRNPLIIKRFVLIYIAVNTSPHFFSGASKVCPPLPTRGEATSFPGFSRTGRENLGTRLGGRGWVKAKLAARGNTNTSPLSHLPTHKSLCGEESLALTIVNLHDRTGDDRRRQTLSDKRDHNFV